MNKRAKAGALVVLAAALLAGCASTGEKVRATEIHNQQSVDLAAELFLLKGPRAPTVVLLHGCGGPKAPQTKARDEVLFLWGFFVVFLD